MTTIMSDADMPQAVRDCIEILAAALKRGEPWSPRHQSCIAAAKAAYAKPITSVAEWRARYFPDGVPELPEQTLLSDKT